ncbi:MAG: DUF192 domain-containing protein [Patescibacteria group bacterium]
MRTAERIVMVILVLVLSGGALWFYLVYQHDRQSLRDAVARGEFQLPLKEETVATEDDWRKYYPALVPVVIGSTTVQASVADSIPERIKGLSDTPYLPEGVVKLFAFGAEGEHGIWMKDMNYSIDIIWVAKSGIIVHLEENVAPETYPQSFSSPKPAWYVVEATAGFVAANGIALGDQVVVPGQ